MSAATISPASMARIRLLLKEAGVVDSQLIEKFVLGSGRGGQKVNKTSSCVYLRHVPSGMEVKCRRTRSREVNRWLARRLLAERLLEQAGSERSARLQQAERIRRQKRRRCRRQKERMLEDKHQRSERKRLRRPVDT